MIDYTIAGKGILNIVEITTDFLVVKRKKKKKRLAAILI